MSTCTFPGATFSVCACRTALDFHDAGTYTTSSFVRDDLQAYQVLVTVGFCRDYTRVSKLNTLLKLAAVVASVLVLPGILVGQSGDGG